MSRARLLAFGAAGIVAFSIEARAEPIPFDDSHQLQPTAPTAPEEPKLAPPTLEAFSYVRRQEKQYLRAALEVATILVVGNVDYLLNTTSRGGALYPGDQTWDLRYEWSIFRGKLAGDRWTLDTNKFNTNYISHPFAGTMYYSAARANHLNVFESMSYALAASVTWEMFGELKEDASVNDVIVTSGSGFTIGEPLMQFSSFFYRSRKSVRNDVLAAIFSPVKAINDWADGAEHARSSQVDAIGLTKDEWHRFELFAGGGFTTQRGGTYGDMRAGIDMRIVNLRSYGSSGPRHDIFDDGNDATLHFESTLSSTGLADATFRSRIVPFGFFEKEAIATPDGDVVGDSVLGGFVGSFEYSVHDYARDGSRPIDLISSVSPLGATFEYRHDSPTFRARTSIDLTGHFSGVTSWALDDFRTVRFDDTGLATVLRNEGYYHAFGASLVPTVQLGWRAFDVGARALFDSWRGLKGLDQQYATLGREESLSDQRVELRGWLAANLPLAPVRLELGGKRRMRTGQAGNVQSSTVETSLYANAGLVF